MSFWLNSLLNKEYLEINNVLLTKNYVEKIKNINCNGDSLPNPQGIEIRQENKTLF